MRLESLNDDNANNSINCNVASCNYNNEKGKCTLKSIQVSCTCNKHNCNDTYDTICNSFCPNKNHDYEMAEEIMEELII